MAEQLNTKSKDSSSRSQRMARASWVFPLVAIVVVSFLKPSNLRTRFIVELFAFLLSVIGLGCGVTTLFSLRTAGAKKIFLPALTGIAINSLLLFIWIVNFIKAIA